MSFSLLIGNLAFAESLKWNHKLTKEADPALKAAYSRLTEPQPVKGKSATGLTLERPGFKLALVEGTLYQEQTPIAGDARGYLFTGTAEITFSVADPAERHHFSKYAGTEEWKPLPVASLYVLPVGPGEPFAGPFEQIVTDVPAAAAELKHALLMDGFYTLEALLNRTSRNANDILVLFPFHGDVWAYGFDSDSDEEVSLCRLGHPPGSDAWWWDKAVSQHLDSKGGLTRGLTNAEAAAKVRVDAKSVQIGLAVSASGEITSGSARVEFAAKRPARALLLAMNPMFEVAACESEDGTPLPFLQCDYSETFTPLEGGILILRPDGAPAEGRVTVTYKGKLFEDSGHGSLVLKEEDYWYPVLPDFDGASFDITVAVPSKYEVVSIGDLVERKETGDQASYHFRFADKSPMATLLIGKYRHHKENAAGIAVDVVFPDNVWTAKNQDEEKSIRTIVFNCLTINSKLFGPSRYPKLSVGECSYGHGRGFPTLLLLSGLIDPGAAQYAGVGATLDQALVAHETGHQWWGNIVEPLTYRDAWLSEAMAELASLDYAMVVLGPKGPQKVKDYLASARFNLAAPMASSRTPRYQEGPISLGYRLRTTLDKSNPYQEIVYTKGAWAMIYLRRIAAARGSMNNFYLGLQDFLKSYGGRKASAEDFRKVMERRLAMDLGWFFEQFFGRTEIPNATVKIKASEVQGKWVLHAEGTQDTDFKLPIPIRLEWGGDKATDTLFMLDGRQGAQDIPLEGKPASVKVDPLGEVLAIVKD